MSAGEGSLAALLRQLYDPATHGDQKRDCELQLKRFANSLQGIEWALSALQDGSLDVNVQFFAASVLESATAPQKWPAFTDPQRAMIRQCAWHRAVEYPVGLPNFVVTKLLSTLAQVAVQEWQPQFWVELQAYFRNPRTALPAVHVLGAMLEHLQSVATATTASFKGKLLCKDIPIMQARLREAQAAALPMVAGLLQHLGQGGTAMQQTWGERYVTTTVAALNVLRNALSGLQVGATAVHSTLGTVAAALCPCILLFGRLESTDADYEMTSLAAQCLEELLLRPCPPECTADILRVCLAPLGSAFAGWKTREMARQAECVVSYAEKDAIGAYVRLMVEILQRHLSLMERTPGMLANLKVCVESMSAGLVIRPTPLTLILAAELYHAILSHLESIDGGAENGCYDRWGGADRNISSVEQAWYKKGVLEVVKMFLSLLVVDTSSRTAPFISGLCFDPGSGVELEERLVLLAGNADDGKDTTVAVAACQNEDWQLDVEGGAEVWGLRPWNALVKEPSEGSLFVHHVECFISRAANAFFADISPRLEAMKDTQGRHAIFKQLESLETVEGYKSWLDLFKCNCITLQVVVGCLGRTAGLYPINNADAGGVSFSLSFWRNMVELAEIWLIHFPYVARFSHQFEQHLVTDRGFDNANAAVQAFARVCCEVIRALGAFSAAWLPQLLMKRRSDAGDNSSASYDGMMHDVYTKILGIITLGFQGPFETFDHTTAEVTLAAGACFLSMTSVALSSSLKPPLFLLRACTESEAVHRLRLVAAAGVQPRAGWPSGAVRALWVGLSDLHLRSWTTNLQSGAANVDERANVFSALVAPLLARMDESCTADELEKQRSLRVVAAIAADILQNYAGSPKVVRKIAYSTFVGPLLSKIAAKLQGGYTPLALPLFRVLQAALQSFSLDIGTTAVGELLNMLIISFSTQHQQQGQQFKETEIEMDLALLSVIKHVVSVGGDAHKALAMPALQYGMQILSRAKQHGKLQAQAQALATLLGIVRFQWKTLGLTSMREPLTMVLGSFDLSSAPFLAVLLHVCKFFHAVADGQSVPAASDIRAILEEFFELQAFSKVLWRPELKEYREEFMDSILRILLSRMFTAAQEDLIDTLYGLASSNWSAFLLGFVPAFIERRMHGLGVHASEVAGAFGVSDMGPSDFEKSVLAFVSDALYWEQTV